MYLKKYTTGTEEPLSFPDINNFYKMNIGKFNQCCTNGTDMVALTWLMAEALTNIN